VLFGVERRRFLDFPSRTRANLFMLFSKLRFCLFPLTLFLGVFPCVVVSLMISSWRLQGYPIFYFLQPASFLFFLFSAPLSVLTPLDHPSLFFSPSSGITAFFLSMLSFHLALARLSRFTAHNSFGLPKRIPHSL